LNPKPQQVFQSSKRLGL